MTELADASRHCQTLAREHYENFPTASLLLSSRVRPAVAAIYAFARTADDFADEPEYAGSRRELLDSWERSLDAALDDRPDGPVMAALAQSVRQFDLPVQALRDLLEAFRSDSDNPVHPDFDSLLRYSEKSANPVGRLVLALHDIRDPGSLAASDAICTGLQLTNFWQDVAVDLPRGRSYLPQAELDRFGLSLDGVGTDGATPAYREMMASLIERTRMVFAGGWPLARETRGRLGLWLRCVWAGGHAILGRVEEVEGDVFTQRPKLSTLDRIRLAAPAVVGLTRPRPPARAMQALT
ncbi:MAG: squalene synthase HpnC [Acidobacteriota bacterium]